MSIKILDCTFRDGGYYNNWDFDYDIVEKYLTAMSLSGVDVVEIGFRFLPKPAFYGAFAYSTDDYLIYLKVPDNLKLSVMINASEFLLYPDGGEVAVDTYFVKASSSPVSIVRVAVRVNEIISIKSIVLRLKELGYKVAVNLMQVDSLDDEKISMAAIEISMWDAVDILYFADSLGNLDPDSTRRIVKTLMSSWSGELGFHAHDNKSQALVNCIAAAIDGVTWLDSTLLGMGRGAGNVCTERLMIEAVYRKWGIYNINALYSLVINDFNLLQKKYMWGSNIFYHIAAIEGIHPTYVQELLSSDRYSLDQILLAIKNLNGNDALSYNANTLGVAIRCSSTRDGQGSWSPRAWINLREVLIIGAGPSTKRHIGAISNYINKNNPIVLCLNVNNAVPSELVSAYVACHESRILIESNQYRALKKPIILPLARVPKSVSPLLDGVDVLDYGLSISEDKIVVNDTGCTLPSLLAVGYALAVAISSQAKRILLAGFDGYASGDSRQDEMVEILDLYQQMGNTIQIISVTSTTYPIAQRSIYESKL